MQRNVKLYKKVRLLWLPFLIVMVSNIYAQEYSYLIPNNLKLNTVVIDAGHGGYDKGAVGYHHKEKDIALDIALKLGNQLKQDLPGVNILFTRTDDSFISLKERAQFANRNQADLFISIHCNASDKSAAGSEVYILGKSYSSETMNVAIRENNSILIEDGGPSNYGNFLPDEITSYDYMVLANSHYNQSMDVARSFSKSMSTIDLQHRGVKEAAFIVLKESKMPAILVETGFITNSKEEAYISSTRGKSEMANAISQGIKNYKIDLDRKAKLFLETKKKEIERIEAKKRRKEEERLRIEAARIEAARLAELKKQREMESNWAWQAIRTIDLEGEQYLVQLLISKSYDEKDFPFKNMVMNRIKVIDSYKYLVGPVSTLEEAKEIHKKAQAAGFRNAFILTYIDGKIVR